MYHPTKPQNETYYGAITNQVLKKAQSIKLLICDVDGVLSDGMIYMGNQGEELKVFNVRDGYGICCLLKAGIEVAIITGCSAPLVKNRCRMLGIVHLYQGQLNKVFAFNELLHKLSLCTDQVAYIGDDLIDWAVMEQIGLSVAVANAHPSLLSKADYVTKIHGGRGAVRELCDLILLAQGKLDKVKGLSI